MQRKNYTPFEPFEMYISNDGNWFTDSKFYFINIQYYTAGMCGCNGVYFKNAVHSWNFKFSPVNNNDWCAWYIYAVLPAADDDVDGAIHE